MTDRNYPRDLRGYGGNPPDADWPDGARMAVQFVVNFEEGAENCVLHGDTASEAFLSEIVGAEPIADARHMNMESIYEYGARAGFWRLNRIFTERELPVTVFGVAMALERCPDAVAAMLMPIGRLPVTAIAGSTISTSTRTRSAGISNRLSKLTRV